MARPEFKSLTRLFTQGDEKMCHALSKRGIGIRGDATVRTLQCVNRARAYSWSHDQRAKIRSELQWSEDLITV